MEHMVICLSRQFGSGGREIGQRLAERLGISFYDRELIELAAARGEIRVSKLEDADERRGNPWLFESLYEGNGAVNRGSSPNDTLYWLQSEVIRDKARKENCILVGRCGDQVLTRAGIPHMSIYVCAPLEERIKRISSKEQIDERSALALIRKTDKQRKAYYEYYTGGSWGAPESYDLCINSAKYGVDQTVELLVRYFQAF